MRRTIAAVAAAALMAAGAPAAALSHQPGEPGWQACGPHGMLCGAITVPVGKRATSLRLAMLPATGTRRGAVLYAPGGPGKDGIQQVRDSAPILADLRRHFDVVAFETRYQKAMTELPESCSVAAVPLMSEPRDRADFDRQAALRREAFTRCAAADGTGLFTRTDSAAVARDMDAVRAALGERRINVMAESYGGITATAYARLFPHRVRAMHLDSTVDHTDPAGAALGMAAMERMLHRFAGWCARDDSCALHGRDARKAWRDLVRRADRDPVPVSSPRFGSGRLTGFHLQLIGTGFVGGTRPGLWPAFAELIRQAEGGDFTVFGEQALGLSFQLSQPRNVAAWCGDGFGITSYDRFVRESQRLRESAPHFGRAAAMTGLACAGWPDEPANPPRPMPVSKLPPLLGSGSWTDHDQTAALVGRVPGSATVRYDGPGHVLFISGASRCVAGHVVPYFERLLVPPRGTSCRSQ